MRQKFGHLIFACVLATLVALSAQAQKPNAKQTETFTFLTINDPISPNNAGGAALRKLVADTQEMTLPPAFVVLTGSVTATGNPEEYGRLRDLLAPLTTAKVNFHAVPGSRDVLNSAEGREGFVHLFGAAYRSFDYGAAHFVLLDSTLLFSKLGHFDKAELDWLEKDLRRVKPDTPIFVFLHHTVGQEPPFTRPLDNENDLFTLLNNHNVLAIFTGGPGPETGWKSNGILTLPMSPHNPAAYYRVVVTPLLVTVERVSDRAAKPVVVASLPIAAGAHPSLLRVAWDDPDIPYLERRRPAATLEPRALSDNPDKEQAEYQIDEGPWKPMTKDRRDIWRDQFATQKISIGMHSAVVHLTTSNAITYTGELLFEVERSNTEPTRKWAVDLSGPIQSSPLLLDQTLYVSCMDGKLYALNIQNGKRRWAFPSKGQLLASPVADAGTLYLGSTDHNLYAVEIATGHQRWKHDMGGPVFGTAAVAKGIVCVNVGGRNVGLDAATGNPRWERTAGAFAFTNAMTDGSLFFLGGENHTLTALDATTGTPKWSLPLGNGAEVVALPVVESGRVYACSTDGWLHCVRISDGIEAWKRRPTRTGTTVGYQSPAIVGSHVVVTEPGPEGYIVALDAITGDEQWGRQLHQPLEVGAAPHAAPDGKSLAVMSVRGHVAVLDAADGKPRWSYELGPGNILSTPEYDGSIVYTVTMANDVQALNGPGIGGTPPRGQPAR
ncbi:MAG TPA: PQQ-binding-like beta-propeller repeat protein [Chthonomonadaceae bacterium]|nr:PQQ-binding-like beta-propeller repeat protein [Chthonomonadaceae bacterium]